MILFALLALPVPVYAHGVVFANSDPQITIHSTFAGEILTLFGNVEPGVGQVPETGPYDVIVIVRGPASDRVVRMKSRRFGLILNADEAHYSTLPGYYAVILSRPFKAMNATKESMSEPRFSLSAIVAHSRMRRDGSNFDAELIRLMSEMRLFYENERGVTFLSPTTFSTQVNLPSNMPNGLYVAQAFVISGGDIVGASTISFNVRTEGLERFISRSAKEYPLLYGIGAVIIAVTTGWIGGILFKR